MTYSDAMITTEAFLTTLDEFGITSGEPDDNNYLCKYLLTEYWKDKGMTHEIRNDT